MNGTWMWEHFSPERGGHVGWAGATGLLSTPGCSVQWIRVGGRRAPGSQAGRGGSGASQGGEDQAAGRGLTLTAGETLRPFPPPLPNAASYWTITLSVPPRPAPALRISSAAERWGGESSAE